MDSLHLSNGACTVLGNTSSLNFFLSQEWEGVNDIGHWTRTKEGLMAKTSGGTKEN